MRKRLMAAAAIAPLSMIGWQAADAQSLTITNNTSTPVATATAVNGGPADVTLGANTTFTLNGPGAALTLNSANTLTNAGTIGSKNVDGAVGLLIQGPSGAVSNTGAINLSEDFTPNDNVNSDGLAEAPYAQGSNRIGIRLTGPFTGAVTNSGSITVQGNASSGISIENTLNGALVNSGAISMTGDNSYGIRTTGAINGAVTVSGPISVKGQNSVGVETNGAISGPLTVYNSIQSTGYAIAARQTGTVLSNIQATPADLQQSGSALQIRGDVLGGVFLAAPPAGTVSTDTTTDADGDGVVDSAEGTASLTTYGSAPALRIGGPGAITLGNFGSGNNAYGLIIGGAVSGQGLWDGVESTGVEIAGAGVNLTGGVKVTGTVGAQSYQANATAIRLGSGVTGQAFVNNGAISATLTSAGAHTAKVLQIDAGASLPSLTNTGSMAASTTGNLANASVIVDNSGTLSNITNTGAIAATLNAAAVGEQVKGQGIALDLRANTTGVTLTQQLASGSSTAPILTGDVLLGSGPNTVNLLSGSMTGGLSLGSAPGSLTIDGGATYVGALTYSGSQLAINLANGILQDNSPTTIGASSLTVGGSSTLVVALDPQNNRNSQFNVSGAAIFAPGAKIGATLLSTPTISGQTFTIVNAGSLAADSALNNTKLTSLPYLFDGSLNTDLAARRISITVRTKTAAEMGLNKAEAAAFGAIYAALPQDTGIQTAIVTAVDRKTLIANYDQLLPNSSGDVFQTAFGMSRAVSRAAADRFDTTAPPEDEEEGDFITSGFWASEFYSGVEQTKKDNNPYHSAALGLIGGYDFGGTGVTLSLASSNITVPGQVGDSLNTVTVVEGGFYAAPRFGALSFDARVGAGYLKVSNRRQFVASVVSGDLSTTSTVSRTADSDWSGYDLSGHLGAGLQFDVSRHIFFQPRLYADVFHVHENAYTERNGGQGFNFAVSQRTGTQSNAIASVVTGLRFGNNFVISPQLEIGYDKVLSGGPGDTTARFAYGGPSFTLAANRYEGAAMARLTVRGDGNYVHFSLQGGGEYTDNYRALDLKAVFRLTF